MTTRYRIPALLLALACGTQAAPAAAANPPPARAQVLVLGTYHMANPGHDLYDLQADDVLAPRRQAEMGALMTVLERFAPTRIAVESDAGDSTVPQAYADYLAGRHALTRNEIEQIGFRLARAMGHKTIYPVDADGEFPYARVVDYAKAHGRYAELEAMSTQIGTQVKELDGYLAGHSVLQTLLRANSDDFVARDSAFYFRQAGMGETYDWAGADLVAAWYQRNIRIYSNILQLVDSPQQRVLVIFGFGHLAWLRADVAGNPDLQLRRLSEFAR